MLTEANRIAATDKCEPLDVAEAEAVVQKMADAVQDLVVNVDITNIQYSLDKMIGVASDLGFSDEELESLGLDLKESRCTGAKCLITPDKIKFLKEIQKG